MTPTTNQITPEPAGTAATAGGGVAPEETAPAARGAEGGGSRFDVQRAALEQVMGLLGECARDYAELEQAHAAQIKQDDDELARTLSALSSDYALRRSRIFGEANEVTAEFETAFEERKAAIDAEASGQRSELDRKERRTSKQLEKEHGDAVWLVDTMLEGETARIAEANQTAKTAVKEDAAQLQQLQDQAEALARSHRQTLGATAAEAASYAGPAPTSATALTAALESRRRAVGAELRATRRSLVPRLVLGPAPWAIGLLIVLAAGAAGHLISARGAGDFAQVVSAPPNWGAIGGAGGVALVVVGGLYIALRGVAGRQIRSRAQRVAAALAQARAAAKADLETLSRLLDEHLLAAKFKHESEMRAADARHERHVRTAQSRYEKLLGDLEGNSRADLAEATAARDAGVGAATSKRDAAMADLDAWRDRHIADARRRRQEAVAAADKAYADGRAELIARWHRALRITRDLSDESDLPEFAAIRDWRAWRPPRRFAPTVRFGELAVDMRRFVGEARQTENGEALIGGTNGQGLRLPIPDPFTVPALLAFPDHANLLIRHEPDGRDAAVATLRLTMLRLLTSLPPGRVQFTLIDAVGLGRSFAGFMHLSDFETDLVGGRVWTEPEAIEQRLTDLTEHMETVIQKYLRNEFETIDAYNAQAGELAEPYRFVVIADLPTGFSERALARLASIAASGTRCGVHVLAALDTRQSVRDGATFLEDLGRHCNTLLYEQGEDGRRRFRWQDPTFGRLPLALDAPPDESALTDVLRVLGQAARDAKRVEVPFEAITPSEQQTWSLDSAADLHVPIGRTGATRLQTFRLGRGVAQHALIAGKTGSGKSTLLNGLITNLSLWYAPDQLELYLIDFKRGVEFMAFATGGLPHARVVAVESDREFGLSVLQRLDEELARRGDLFRAAGVQDLGAYRRVQAGKPMPRVLLVVDEFQELFSEDDKLTQDAALLIDRLVRQGRAFGIHVILGSQTIGGQSGLGRATLGQMAVRVALQCTETDSQLILGDSNTAARLLKRPGEAIYNEGGGAVEFNSPFQVAWLDDQQRDALVRRARERARHQGLSIRPPIVFEGNAAADLRENEELAAAVAGRPVRTYVIYLGDPVAIKEPTHLPLRRQAGANVLVVGQQEESVLAVAASALLSLTATAASSGGSRQWPRFVLLDGTPGDAPRAGYLAAIARRLPCQADVVDYRAMPEAFADLADELHARLDLGAPADRPIVLLIHGIQRYRSLSRSDDFSIGSLSSATRSGAPAGGGGGGFADILGEDAGEPGPPAPAAGAMPPDQVLLELLRNGPMVGLHVLMTADTLGGFERRLGRDGLREVDLRVLFQMSGNDSSVLIDSLAANRLGFYRGLVASEELGTLEKFRPYAPPDEAFIKACEQAMKSRA